jgi:hypothetical protein
VAEVKIARSPKPPPLYGRRKSRYGDDAYLISYYFIDRPQARVDNTRAFRGI